MCRRMCNAHLVTFILVFIRFKKHFLETLVINNLLLDKVKYLPYISSFFFKSMGIAKKQKSTYGVSPPLEAFASLCILDCFCPQASLTMQHLLCPTSLRDASPQGVGFQNKTKHIYVHSYAYIHKYISICPTL